MKKKLLLALATVLTVFAVPLSASAIDPTTLVSGTVRAGGSPLSGATVTVTCNSVSDTDTTDGSGGYAVQFTAADCPNGSTVNAVATKGGASGSNSGLANQVGGTKLNVAVVDVDVALPEMGAIVGGIGALGAGGAFLIVRRRQQKAEQQV